MLMLMEFFALTICFFLGLAVTVTTLAITVITAVKTISKFL